VRCLKTARAALDGIVTQGEGAPGNAEGSHYQRFLDIRREYQALSAARPAFVPARPAAHNPVMRSPLQPHDRVWVELRPAAELLDLVNAAYNQMLRLLIQAYAETRGADLQRALVDAGIELMFVLSPVASALTRLPASSTLSTCTAGMSFATLRGYAALTPSPASDRVLLERLGEIAAVAARLGPDLPGGDEIPQRLAQLEQRLAQSFGGAVSAGGQQQVAPSDAPAAPEAGAAPAPPPPAPSTTPVSARVVPPSVMADGVESVEGAALTLQFEAKRCIHARHCVLGQPGVFLANVQGPWLDPDAAHVEALVTVAHMCPSGAIRYRRKDGGADEAAPPVNLVQLRENGPLGLRGELIIDGKPAGFRATLCRCGASQNKPFCDGSHVGIGFVASGEPATRPSEPLATRNGPLDIRPQRNGPLLIRGNLELCAGTGRTIDRVTQVRLCRCGGSSNKPLCDGTHARINFQT
jgi:CDGSH-type Zn-finger protein/uncharacterized Fe-S cluster protein YjdI